MLQGVKVDSLLQEEDAESHARVRKAFQGFFCTENIDAVILQLTHEVELRCGTLAAQANATGGGATALDAVKLASDLIDAVVTKVLFQSSQALDLASFHDALMHMAASFGNPLAIPLIRHGLHPGFFRYRANWHGTRQMWVTLMSEVYSRPDEPESVAFWACLRRAFPDAETDSEQWERALANGAVMCDVLGAMTLRS
jgi:hypothetical protein